MKFWKVEGPGSPDMWRIKWQLHPANRDTGAVNERKTLDGVVPLRTDIQIENYSAWIVHPLANVKRRGNTNELTCGILALVPSSRAHSDFPDTRGNIKLWTSHAPGLEAQSSTKNYARGGNIVFPCQSLVRHRLILLSKDM